jgi:hypothetical protein
MCDVLLPFRTLGDVKKLVIQEMIKGTLYKLASLRKAQAR